MWDEEQSNDVSWLMVSVWAGNRIQTAWLPRQSIKQIAFLSSLRNKWGLPI